MAKIYKVHENWSSRFTFVLAGIGAAVGLGNIWKFPYLTGQNGGGAFVLVYVMAVLFVALPILIAEIAIGRWGGQSPPNAMANVAAEQNLSRAWPAIGWVGMLAAYHRDGWIDRSARLFSLAGVSIPNFWLGPVAMLLFSIQLDLLPVSGRSGWQSLVLPAGTLGLALAALLTRMVRSAVGAELGRPYLVTARAKGISRSRVALLHALKNAMIPVVTVVGLQFGALLTGAILTETIFSWPGLGRLLIQAIRLRDYPLVQGCVLLISVTYVLVNLATDLLYAWLDPRIRLQEAKAEAGR